MEGGECVNHGSRSNCQCCRRAEGLRRLWGRNDDDVVDNHGDDDGKDVDNEDKTDDGHDHGNLNWFALRYLSSLKY